MEPVLSRFLEDALRDPSGMWSPSHIADISRLEVPEQLFSGRRELLRCDINYIWALWFLESLYDPIKHVAGDFHEKYASVYSEVLTQVNSISPTTPLDERIKAARLLAKLVQGHVQRRVAKKRPSIDRDTKLMLLDAVVPEIRCWMCGHRFSEIAVERFENGHREPNPVAQFVDCFKQNGLRRKDRDIEVDHVVPYSSGGGEEGNLALACGWCNRHKGAFSSVYDQALSPLVLKHPTRGRLSIPRPFWVVRLLATRRRCEFAGGCGSTTSGAELTVMLRNPAGAANPTNLVVVCNQHDEMQKTRYIPRHYLESLLQR